MSIHSTVSEHGRRRSHGVTRAIAVTALGIVAAMTAAGQAVADRGPARPHMPTASAASTTDSPSSVPRALGGAGIRYAVPKRACPAATRTSATCMAVRLDPASKTTKGAIAFSAPTLTSGPAGGLTPANLATAYAYSRTSGGSTQTVAIVDAYDDPHALSDLNAFNHHYGLPAETSTSFRKVNQNGATSPLPAANSDWALEIALDVQAVRAVCAQCKILLVEAASSSTANLATAVNTAARLKATEISNSYGGREYAGDSAQAAYTHPGIVVTASTGDDGWYGWDRVNSDNSSDGAPSAPASYPDVVAVGGTALTLNSNGTRHTETVWNENGLENSSVRVGATGGGCSTTYAAPSWQADVANFDKTGCGTNRMTGDIAAVGDPYTGFDVYATYGASGWLTIGGTSLSSPLVAAMWALAGGSGGAAHPAQSLYENLTYRPTSVYDVQAGGNGYCGGDVPATCSSKLNTQVGTGNPNNLSFDGGTWAGVLDCAFPFDGSDGIFVNYTQCNAAAGYDGPSGVGTPNGLSVFKTTQPTVAIKLPASMKLKTSATFTAANFTDPRPGAHAVSYSWHWGDGTVTDTASGSATHAYTKAGAATITLDVVDNDGRTGTATAKITVGVAPVAKITGPTTLKLTSTGKWSSTSSTSPNTGGTIVQRSWKFGPKTFGTGTTLSHKFTSTGKRTLTLTVVDNAGLRATKSITVNVTK